MRAIILLCLLRAALAFNNPWEGPIQQAVPEPNEGSACSADEGSCGCCLTLQKVDRLRAYLATTLLRLEQEFVQTNQSLGIVEASRIAFSVALFSDLNFRCIGPFSTDVVIAYQHVFLNLGGGYSADTGVFTVRRSGVYSLAVSLHRDAGSPGVTMNACMSLKVNNQAVLRSKEFNKADHEDSVTSAVVMQLSTGDSVAVNLPAGCSLCDVRSHHNTFSAFLLYAT